MARPNAFLCFVFSLAISLHLQRGTLTAQTLPGPLTGFGGVSVSDEAGLIDSTDTTSLRLIDNRILQAELEMKRTAFWRRIIPEVRLSGSIGVRDILFLDPATATPYILPRDSYRITLTLSLSDVLDFDRHTLAVLQHDQLLVQRELLANRLRSSETALCRQYERLLIELTHLREESDAVDALEEYTELLFSQGEKQFDDLIRVRLQTIALRRAVNRTTLHLEATPVPGIVDVLPALTPAPTGSLCADSASWYPNAAGRATISFVAQDSTQVSRTVAFHTSHPVTMAIRVHNILGHAVASSGTRFFERGDHTIELDGFNLHAGVYFLVLETPSCRTVKQVVWVP